jgi:hypothetical protein
LRLRDGQARTMHAALAAVIFAVTLVAVVVRP